jgi:hypothetical protein
MSLISPSLLLGQMTMLGRVPGGCQARFSVNLASTKSHRNSWYRWGYAVGAAGVTMCTVLIMHYCSEITELDFVQF